MLFQLKYPIIQAPMAGNIVTPELVAMVSNAGMLGSIAAGYLDRDSLTTYIQKVTSLTDKPFLLNIFIEEARPCSLEYTKPQKIVEYERKVGLAEERFFSVPATVSQEDYLKVILEYQIRIVSSTFGLFKPEILKKLKQNQVKVIASVTSIAEAEAAICAGYDALVIQGAEAGGHQASFLGNEANLTNTLDLFKKVRQQFSLIPLIAAGGINQDNIEGYWKAGVNILQLGTVFMLSDLSALGKEMMGYIINDSHKITTQLSPYITGKWVRGIANKLLDELKDNDYPFPVQHYATSRLRSQARKLGNYDYSGIWLGQHDKYQIAKTSELIKLLQDKYYKYMAENANGSF